MNTSLSLLLSAYHNLSDNEKKQFFEDIEVIISCITSESYSTQGRKLSKNITIIIKEGFDKTDFEHIKNFLVENISATQNEQYKAKFIYLLGKFEDETLVPFLKKQMVMAHQKLVITSRLLSQIVIALNTSNMETLIEVDGKQDISALILNVESYIKSNLS